MKNTIVLLTALLPTTGHADLIKFASSITDSKVHVLINGRTFEPVPSLDRWQDLHDHFKHYGNVEVRHSVDDSAPQRPEDMPEGFWEWWKGEINKNFPLALGHWDYVVASESYGQKLAETINADFIPYDISRKNNPIKSTDARRNPWELWSGILPETRKRYKINAVMFGQESVGKTTISKALAKRLNVNWITEYARPYLETFGPELSPKVMDSIHAGQLALQRMNLDNVDHPVLIFDTDLLTTVGSCEALSVCPPSEELLSDARKFAADVYYVLPDDIPFEEDFIRYGEGVRESDKQFWINILENNRQNYKIVPNGLSFEQKVEWIAEDIITSFYAQFIELSIFERELVSQ